MVVVEDWIVAVDLTGLVSEVLAGSVSGVLAGSLLGVILAGAMSRAFTRTGAVLTRVLEGLIADS